MQSINIIRFQIRVSSTSLEIFYGTLRRKRQWGKKYLASSHSEIKLINTHFTKPRFLIMQCFVKMS